MNLPKNQLLIDQDKIPNHLSQQSNQYHLECMNLPKNHLLDRQKSLLKKGFGLQVVEAIRGQGSSHGLSLYGKILLPLMRVGTFLQGGYPCSQNLSVTILPNEPHDTREILDILLSAS
ncbi:hypothetical protein AXX17_AT1G35860 [Arabidopsis thaliana]|uniref:Uncharacterized protein n=1 Tax=Arabidopsis thaliana TaxID=3702 RepID=A0A178W8C7_ARATH|nr:hypothetical protein AXX17_AT1G35860 [Arabidopsis thaliana]